MRSYFCAAPKLRTLHVCPSGAPNVATNPLGRENISEERFLEPAFRPAKPGLIAQQGCHLRWPIETFRCARDRMSYSFFLALSTATLSAALLTSGSFQWMQMFRMMVGLACPRS